MDTNSVYCKEQKLNRFTNWRTSNIGIKVRKSMHLQSFSDFLKICRTFIIPIGIISM